MRRPPRSAFAALLILIAPAAARGDSEPEPEPVVVSVDSTLSTVLRQIRQLAFDGDPRTAFVSEEYPTPADHFTLFFDKPVTVKSVSVLTGLSDGSDRLEAGTLEVSADGATFTELSKFADGEVRAEPKGAQAKVQAVRIKPSADHKHPLAVREFAIESDPPLIVFRYPVEIVVDVSDSPGMRGWAGEVARLCERWYPRLNDQLRSKGYNPPQQITMRVTKTYKGVAEALGDRITGSTAWFTEHPDDVGAMIHETAHIVQQYGYRNNPVWLVEGVADYVRFYLFEPGKLGPLDPHRDRYNHSYRKTAAFLAYLADTYDKDLVMKVNRVMREGRYKDSIFKDLTDKSLSELDEEWRSSLKP